MIIVNKVVVFDLDDTLYKEIDFLKSAFLKISFFLSDYLQQNACQKIIYDKMLNLYFDKQNVFEQILKLYNINRNNLSILIEIYRNHKPLIKLSKETINTLNYIKDNRMKIGLITDGRSKQQRNKIEALGLINYIDDIIISEEFGSEKPSLDNYKYFSDKYGKTQYYYIGDNIEKDFIAPNKLGWTTIGLIDNGENIQKQNRNIEREFLPKYWIKSLIELKTIGQLN